MKPFILDANLVFRWLIQSTLLPEVKYCTNVLESLIKRPALVPGSWRMELATMLLLAERKKLIAMHDSQRFLAQIEKLPINADSEHQEHVFNHTMFMAREYNVSNYLGGYVELALRTGYPIATINPDLDGLLKQCKIAVYDPQMVDD